MPMPGATAGAAIGANVGNLPGAVNLGTGVNRYLEDSLISNYNMAIPDYTGMAAQSSQNIGAELRGELPQDVLDQIYRSAAERGIATGAPGSANEQAALLRSVGLTSLDLTGRGEQQLSGAVARSPIAQPFDISRLFVTPEQEQEAQMMSNIYASAPVPSAAAKKLESLSTGVGPPDSLPWYVSGAERAALHSPAGAHYNPITGAFEGAGYG